SAERERATEPAHVPAGPRQQLGRQHGPRRQGHLPAVRASREDAEEAHAPRRLPPGPRLAGIVGRAARAAAASRARDDAGGGEHVPPPRTGGGRAGERTEAAREEESRLEEEGGVQVA